MKIMALSQAFPGEVQIVQQKWVRPSWKENDLFYAENGGYDWSVSENVHIGNRYQCW